MQFFKQLTIPTFTSGYHATWGIKQKWVVLAAAAAADVSSKMKGKKGKGKAGAAHAYAASS